MIYYGTYAALLIAIYVGRSSHDIRNIFYWGGIVYLFLFVAFRLDVGCDWSGYLRNYYFPIVTTYGETLSTLEPAHWSIILLLRDLGAPYQYLNAVMAGVFFFGLHVLARRQPDPLAFLVLCFPILIINMPMSGIRQGAAIGLLCLAYAAFIDRKLIAYLAWTMVGSTFHASAAAFLVLAPFAVGRFDRRNIAFATLLAMPGIYVLLQTDAAALAEERYVESDLIAAGAAYRLGLLTVSGLFFVCVLSRPWREKFPDDYKLATIGSWMMIVFFSLFFVSTVIGDRFGYYLIPLQAMIFARIPYLSLGENRILYAVLPYAALTGVFVIWSQFSWHFAQCYIPYQFSFG